MDGNTMTTVLLVDGTNIVMRHAFVMAAAGPLNAVASEEAGRRALKTIRNAARDWRAHYTIIALDVPGESWRRQLFPPYKMNRSEAVKTERFSLALATAAEDEQFMCVGLPGWEADDVVATFAHNVCTAENASRYHVRILSHDSDLLQCVRDSDDGTGPSVSVIHDIDKPVHTEGTVFLKYGVYPKAVPLWKALVGETSDNLPGVSKIGAKRATALIQEHGTLDKIIAVGRTPNGGVLHEWRVYQEEDRVRLVEKLATLRTDAPVPTLGSRARTPSTETVAGRVL